MGMGLSKGMNMGAATRKTHEIDGKRIRWCAGGSAHVRFAVDIR